MMKKRTRILTTVLTLALVLSLAFGTGLTAFAQAVPAADEPVCAHEHDTDCGYLEGAACGHAHDENCGGLLIDEAPAMIGTITGFELAEVNVKQGTPEADLGLPGEVTANVQLDGEGAEPATVTVGVGAWVTPFWSAPYDPAGEALNIYVYEADPASLTLPDGVTLPEDVELPLVRVTVGEYEAEFAPMAAITGTETLTFNGTTLAGNADVVAAEASGSSDPNWGSSRTWYVDDGKLYLNNFDYATTSSTAFTSSTAVEMVLTGNNSILSASGGSSSSTFGIQVSSDKLTISGTGKLTVTAGGGSGNNSYGIYAESLEISTDVMATGGEAKSNSAGIGVINGTFTVNGGTVQAYGDASATSNGIQLLSETIAGAIKGGKLIAKGETAAVNAATPLSNVTVKGGVDNNEDYALVWDSTSKTYGSDNPFISALYAELAPVSHTLYFRNGALRTTNTDGGAEYIGKGTTWTATADTLTLTNFNFTTTANTALSVESDVTIILNGTNTITSGDGDSSYGLYSFNAVTFDGTGSLTVTAGTATSASGTQPSSGIAVYSDLTVAGGTVTAIGGTVVGAGYSTGVEAFTLNVTGGKLIAKADSAPTESRAAWLINTPIGVKAQGRANADSGALADVYYDTGRYFMESSFTTLAMYVELTLPTPTHADPAKDKVEKGSGVSGSGTAADPFVASAGGNISITVAGDRQDAPGSVVGDTVNIPVSWSVNPSGTFPEGGPYVINVTIDNPGNYTLTVNYRVEEWDGSAWAPNGDTYTHEYALRVDAATPSPTPQDSPPATTGGSPQTGDSSNMGLWVALLALSGGAFGGGLLLMRKRNRQAAE